MVVFNMTPNPVVLQLAKIALEATHDKVIALKATIAQQTVQINTLQQNISRQETAIENLKALIIDQENDFRQLENSHIEEKNQLSASIDLLKRQVNESEQQIHRYQEQIKNLRNESSESLKVKELQINELTKQINSQSLQIDQLGQDNQSLLAEFVRIKNEAIQTIERKKIEFEEKIDHLTRNFQEQLNTAELINSKQKEKISTQIKELHHLREQLSDTNQSLADKETLLTSTTKRLEEKNAEFINLERTLSTLQSDLKDKNTIIATTELINQNLLERLKSERQTTSEQLQQISLISGENTNLKNQLSAQLEKISGMTAQIEQNQQKLNETKENLISIEENNISLELKLATATGTIEQLSRKNHDFEIKIDELTRKNEDTFNQLREAIKERD